MPPQSLSVLQDIRERATIAPSLPAEDGESDEALWDNVLAFLHEWLFLASDELYDTVAAWVFLSWRLNDLTFRYVPPLRFAGPPASGKSIALSCTHALSYWARMCRWTPDNLHRVADAYQDGTLFFDELHLDRGREKNAQERMADQMATCWDRFSREVRYDGRTAGVQSFRTFVMFAAAGYAADEHEGIARRSVVIPMERPVGSPKRHYLGTPRRFFDEADALRSRLLAWRFRHAGDAAQDEEGHPLADRLKAVAGSEIGQAFWPLIQMIPSARPEALDRVLGYVAKRRGLVRETIGHQESAHLLSVVAEMIEEGSCILPTDCGARLWVKDLVERARERFQGISSRQVHLELQSAGLKKRQLRRGDQSCADHFPSRFDGYDLDLRDDSPHRRAFEAHGVELPPWDELQERLGSRERRGPL